MPCRHRVEAVVHLYSFSNLGAILERVVSVNPHPLYPWERFLVPVVQETGWSPEQVWKDLEI
jgi:hypothetical protein